MKTADVRESIADLRQCRVSRRDVGKLAAYLGVGIATTSLFGRTARRRTASLSCLGPAMTFRKWRPNITRAIRSPISRLWGSDREGFQKVRAGYQPDLAHDTSFIVQTYRDAGLIDPLDVSQLKHWNEIFHQFRRSSLPMGNLG